MSEVQNLSSFHRLVGPLLKGRQASGDLSRFGLEDKQIDSFNRDGFLGNIKVLEADQADLLLNELDGLFNPGHPGNSLVSYFR